MGVVDDDFAFLVRTAHRLLDQLAAEVAVRVAGGGRGAILAEHIEQTLNAIRSRVEHDDERFSRAQSETAKATLARQLRLLVSLTWAIHEAMPWLDPPRRQLDLGTTFLIDESALAMIGPPIEVLPVESHHYMYWALAWPFEDLWTLNFQEPMPRNTRPIVVAYPAREAPSALLHGAFAHELGHATVDRHDLLSAVVDPIITGTEYLGALNVILGTGIDATTVRAKQSVRQRVEAWVEELLCDQLAVAYLGPSYLFCFAGIALPVTWNEPQEQHPNATMRVRFMVNSIHASGWEAMLSEPVPQIWRWLKGAGAAAPSSSDPVTSLLIKLCDDVEAEVRKHAWSTLGSKAFDAEAYMQVQATLLELLDNDILPAQLDPSTAADHRQILFAAWLHVIHRHGDSPEAIPMALREREYQRFIAKALEMSTTFRTWNEVSTP